MKVNNSYNTFGGIYGNTALMWYSYHGDLNIVKYLIEKGADINAEGRYGDTALIWGSERGNLEVVKYLIKKGDNVKNKYGNIALIRSSYVGHLNIIKYLIDNGADVNFKNKNGDTALIASVGEFFAPELSNINSEIINYLIPLVFEYNQFEKIYNNLKIEQKHILFKHFMNNRELLKQVNLLKMKNFIPDINEYKNKQKT